MDIKNILLFITTGANIGLAFLIYFHDRKNKINIFFSASLLLAALWSFGIAMFRASTDPLTMQLWFNSFYYLAAFISVIFYYFARSFPFEITAISKTENIINVVLLAVLSGMIYFWGIATEIVYSKSFDHDVTFNFYVYIPYVLFFVYFVAKSFIDLSKKMTKAATYSKKLIKIVFFSTLVAFAAGTIFDLILPFTTYRYIWAGPYFTMITVFIIVKYVFIQKLD